jgi:hypothetical protein
MRHELEGLICARKDLEEEGCKDLEVDNVKEGSIDDARERERPVGSQPGRRQREHEAEQCREDEVDEPPEGDAGGAGGHGRISFDDRRDGQQRAVGGATGTRGEPHVERDEDRTCDEASDHSPNEHGRGGVTLGTSCCGGHHLHSSWHVFRL